MFKLKKIIVAQLFLVSWICVFISCNNFHRNKSHAEISNASIRAGEALANKYCGTCHMLPDPSLLDAKTWEEGVLPVMGPQLGIFYHNFKRYPSAKNDKNLALNFYPSQPLLNDEEWQNLVNYYIATSPDSLIIPERTTPVILGPPGFQVQNQTFKTFVPTSSYIKIDTSVIPHQLVLADLFSQKIFWFNDSLKLVDSLQTHSAIVDIETQQNKMLFCNIGEINPNNKKLGIGQTFSFDSNNKPQLDSPAILSGLARPVQISTADFNKDGLKDYLVCEFGFMVGSLSVYFGEKDNHLKKLVLKQIPGAVKAYINDYNNDGLPDIWAQFAQGEEGVFLITNKGNEQFDQKQVIRFPPMYGSTFFELVDFNKDGFEDIVCTCGDNADYSKVLKPYHGIYIFLNDGKNNFEQKYFYHMNGCYKSQARDYDNDGDIDIAAISFFADYIQRPDEGFVYLANEGSNTFKPYSFSESGAGRWLTMDAGDLDGDGKIDIVLGNFIYGPVIVPTLAANWEKGTSFIFLKNTHK
jgi:hypothetical protein